MAGGTLTARRHAQKAPERPLRALCHLTGYFLQMLPAVLRVSKSPLRSVLLVRKAAPGVTSGRPEAGCQVCAGHPAVLTDDRAPPGAVSQGCTSDCARWV